jgi:hypothetical protein
VVVFVLPTEMNERREREGGGHEHTAARLSTEAAGDAARQQSKDAIARLCLFTDGWMDGEREWRERGGRGSWKVMRRGVRGVGIA